MSPVAAANPSLTALPLPLPDCLRILIARPGNSCCTFWISSQVWSRECPSTKMSSVLEPRSGVRSTAARMLPASFRAGITIETLGARPGGRARVGRATMKTVRQRTGRIGASHRFGRLSSPPIRIGQSSRCSARIGLQSARESMFLTSELASQLLRGIGFAIRSSLPRARSGRQRFDWKLRMSRVSGVETECSRSRIAWTSPAKLRVSEMMMTSKVPGRSSSSPAWTKNVPWGTRSRAAST